MSDALTNPPMPDWNELRNEERVRIIEVWEFESCPHACGGSVLRVYEAIREVLQERERRIFKATMDMPLSGETVRRET